MHPMTQRKPVQPHDKLVRRARRREQEEVVRRDALIGWQLGVKGIHQGCYRRRQLRIRFEVVCQHLVNYHSAHLHPCRLVGNR